MLIDDYKKLLSSIDNFGVKEVDLDKPFEDVSVKTSFDSDDNLETITITTEYKKKGEKVWD